MGPGSLFVADTAGRERLRVFSHFIAVMMLFVAASLLLADYYWKPLRGLPIDDSYIFLQYAQNLADHGQLSFNQGDHSFGITSVMWTMSLAAYHRVFQGDFVRESQLLGALLLGITASFWARSFRRLGRDWRVSALVGCALVSDPFLMSHSISGMESALNLTTLSILAWYLIKRPVGGLDATAGVLAGIASLTRPDNLVLAPALAIGATLHAWRFGTMTHTLRRCALFVVGFATIFVPCALWSVLRVGSVIPPTRIGKMLVFLPLHYGLTLEQFNSLGAWGHLSIAFACLRQRIVPMFTTECERVVLPAVIVGGCSLLVLSFRRWQHGLLCIYLSLYSLGLIASYALLFPLVKDRHIPNVHAIAVIGAGLLIVWTENVGGIAASPPGKDVRRVPWSLGSVAGYTVLFISIAGSLFFVSHYRAEYLKRVANINVWCSTGKWLDAHTAKDAKVALEPIGAIKYCSQRYVLDMGGLVTSDTWGSISLGRGSGLESIHQLLRGREMNYVIDHYPNEWLGRLAERFPENYRWVARIEPPALEHAFGATDRFDVFATRW